MTTVVWLSFVVSYVTGAASPDFGKWVVFWALAIVLIAVARSAVRMAIRRRGDLVQRALIVGTDRNAQLVARKLAPASGVRDLARRLRRRLARAGSATRWPTYRCSPARSSCRRSSTGLRSTASCSGSRARPNARCCGSYAELQTLGVQVDVVPRLFEALGPSASVTSIEAMQLVSLPPTRMSRDALLLKRAFDVVGSAALLVLLSPFLAAIAVWIKLDSPGPVLFRQTRLGRDQQAVHGFQVPDDALGHVVRPSTASTSAGR